VSGGTASRRAAALVALAAAAAVAAPPTVRAVRRAVEVRRPPAGEEVVFLGLGGNEGDSIELLSRAVRALHAHPRITVEDLSSTYETEPVGGPEQAPFLNVAVRARTALSPLGLLRACQQVEADLGRVRTVRWGPRTVDVDVLLYGDRVLDAPVLTVPHPRLAERAFAVVPLVEVAPGWRLPDGRTLTKLVASMAPIEGVQAIGRQVSLTPLPSGPPALGGAPRGT
jgi:2-amino-4-hydroxy-6-hydroxymethyldihydropteridine diphosphokinase